MLGDEAFRLAKDAKDISESHIPVYNEEQVRLVTQETRYLWTRIEEMIASLSTAESQDAQSSLNILSQGASSTSSHGYSQAKSQPMLDSDIDGLGSIGPTQTERENVNGQTSLYMLTVGRNKRCLLAYHHRRMEFIRSLLWTLHLAPSLVPPSVTARLSPEEQNFAREYARLNSAYRDAVEEQLCPTESLDWTASGELPPRDIFIEVRVVKDCGEIVTESGVVSLQAGTQHYLRRTDIEHLLTIGYLEHINST
ncbi:DNA replication protein psf1 [Coemansia brasiliensis]|uniref:DNA replication complex GINS protein PSF1 n=1 Tax=Coemansia brasiliensis TaxID=2650707 RepID=A0A9W8I7T7_9FUNG|nr:DNA replication protein psf1 [Coemansia brasiliensis]